MDVVESVNGVPIRLTDERWAHIVDNKPYMSAYYREVLLAIENPAWIVRGYNGALVAIKSEGKKFLNVVYREASKRDGFIITAFVSDRANKRNLVWPSRKS